MQRAILSRARAVLEAHWTAHGYCVPNPTTYPWQWLWDSCFHAVAWAALGDERARGRAHLGTRRHRRRRLRAPRALRGRPDVPRGVLGSAGHLVDHPAADVRPRGGRADPPGHGGARRGRRPGRRVGWASCCAGGPAARAGWSRSCTRGRPAATTAHAGTTGAPTPPTAASGTQRRARC